MGKLRNPAGFKGKTPFGENEQNFNFGNLGHSAYNINTINMNDLGKTYGAVVVPRNVSFAKNLIDGYETNSLQNKRYERKKNKEMNISQAINDYNSYRIYEKSKNKFRLTRSPSPPLSSSRFNLRESAFGINPNSIRGKEVPLNLLEVFSNTEVGALSISFTKYNNPITIDNLSIQIGTIRLNLFVNYLLDILRILSDYKKATNIPQIAKSKGSFAVDGKTFLEVQEYIYNYILNKIPANERTESMIEYMEYLRKEIYSKKKFSTKPEHFALNQIFSIFPKGFDFHFDYENIELVAYDEKNIVSNKMIIPSNEFVFGINFSRIFVKLLDLEIEVSDLDRCESIIEQLKGLAEDKFKVIQIVLKPCYKQIKDGIEPLINDNDEEHKKILKATNNNINNNNNNEQNMNNINDNEIIYNDEYNNFNKNEQEIFIQKKGEENTQEEQLLLQKQKEKDLLDLMIKNHKENELLIKKQKEQDYYNKQPLNRVPNQINQNQIQQKKNMIPKNPVSTNISPNNIQNNYFIEQPNSPRDSIRSKNSKNDLNQNVINNHLPKVESSSSYQLLGQNYMNLNGEINQNYNNNYDFLSNTNYNINTQNINDIRFNQQYS